MLQNGIQQQEGGDRTPLLPHNQTGNGPPSLRSSCNYKGLFGLLLTATGGLLTVGAIKRDTSSGPYLFAGAGVFAISSIWYYFQGSPPPASLSIVTDTEYGAIGERNIELAQTQRRQQTYEGALNHVERFFSDGTEIPTVEELTDFPLWERIQNLSKESATARAELQRALDEALRASRSLEEGKQNRSADAATEQAVAKALDAGIAQAEQLTRLSTQFMRVENLGDLPQVPSKPLRILPKSRLPQTLSAKWEQMNTVLVKERHVARALKEAQHRKNMTEQEAQFKREVEHVKQEQERGFKTALFDLNSRISLLATNLGLPPQTPPRTAATIQSIIGGISTNIQTLAKGAQAKFSELNEGKEAHSQQKTRIKALEEEARTSITQINDLTKRLTQATTELGEARQAAIQKSPDKSAAQAAQRTIASLEQGQAALRAQLQRVLQEKQEAEEALSGLRTELRTARTLLKSRSPAGPTREYVQQLNQISDYIMQAEKDINDGYQLPPPLTLSHFPGHLQSLAQNANAIVVYADALKYPPEQTTPEQSPLRGRQRPLSRRLNDSTEYTPSPTRRAPIRLEGKKRTGGRKDPTTPYTPDNGERSFLSSSAQPIHHRREENGFGNRFSPDSESD